MLEPSRPGRPKLPEWQLSQKYLANRRSLARSYAKNLHWGHLIAEHAVKRSLNRDRLRARPATFEQLRETLIPKFTTDDTWEDFIRARRNNDGNGQAVYRTGVTKLMQLLTADMGIATTPVGAYLDPSTALPLYLEPARAHGCLHDAVRAPQLCVFFDANEMYGRRKCQVLTYIYRKHVSHTNSFGNLLSRDTWTRMITSQPRRSLSAWTCFLPLRRRWRAAGVVKAWSWFFLLIMPPTTEPQGRLQQQQIAVVWSAMVQKNSGSTLNGYGSLCGILTTTLHAGLPSFAS